MKEREEVLKRLRMSTSIAASIAPLFKNIEDCDSEILLQKLGQSLALMFDIDDILCSGYPDLVADQWNLINESKDEFNTEMSKMSSAVSAEENNDIKLAAELYHEIINTSKISDNRMRAEAGLYRISKGK